MSKITLKKIKSSTIMLTAAVLLLSFSIIVAVAASMGMNNTYILDDASASACSSSTIVVDLNDNNNPILENIPPECYNIPFTAHFIRSDGSETIISSNGSNSNTYTSTEVLSSPDNISLTQVFFRGFNLPSSWIYVNSDEPLQPNQPEVNLNITWSQPSATQFCAAVEVSTTSTTPIAWSANLDITKPPSNGDTNINNYELSYGYTKNPNSVVNGKITVVGQNSNATVVNGTNRNFTLCNYNAGNPAINPNATYTVTETPATGPNYYSCKNVTVAVTGTQWRVGWEATVDTADIQNNYLGTGGQVHLNSGGFIITNTNGSMRTVTGNGWNTRAISEGNPVTFEICWGA